jgi:hypothetical protein
MPVVTNLYLRILDEITPSPNYIPEKTEYVNWYKKHNKTIEQQPSKDFCLRELVWAFQEFKDLVTFLEHEQTIIEANNRYKLLDLGNEEEILEWLLEYENVYEFAEHFCGKYFDWEPEKIEGDKIVVSPEIGIKIELSDFKEFIIFEETFNPLITKYKNKFCTDELKPCDTSLQTMLEYHNIR